MCTLINVVFDLFTRIKLITAIMPYGFFLGGSMVAQAIAVYFSYVVFKELRNASAGGQYEMSGGYGGPEDRLPAQNFEDAGHERAAPTGTGQSFVPFGGNGNRLGS